KSENEPSKTLHLKTKGFVEIKSKNDNQLSGNDDWDCDWGNEDDTKMTVPTHGKNNTNVDPEQKLSKLNASKNLVPTNDVGIHSKLQNSEHKTVNEISVSSKKAVNSKRSKPK